MATEEWREVPGSPGYAVSSLGRVKSPSGRLLRASRNGRYGYRSVHLGTARREYVHRLVMLAFVGEPGDLEVDHIDGDTSNNALENLRYLTHGDNLRARRERVTACKRGHEYAEWGYYDCRGRRLCRFCQRMNDRRRYRLATTPSVSDSTRKDIA